LILELLQLVLELLLVELALVQYVKNYFNSQKRNSYFLVRDFPWKGKMQYWTFSSYR